MTTHNVTLGGVAVGSAILIGTLIRWWFKEKHRPSDLVPFVLSIAYGMLLILSGGGLLGRRRRRRPVGRQRDRRRRPALRRRRHHHGRHPRPAAGPRLRRARRRRPHHRRSRLPVAVGSEDPQLEDRLGVLAGSASPCPGPMAGAAAVPLGSGVDALGLVFTKAMA
jgi:hypothetical protein